MQRPLGSPALSDCISRFESELRRAVWEIARSVIAQELSRRSAAERASRDDGSRRARAVNHRRASANRRARGASTTPRVEVTAAVSAPVEPAAVVPTLVEAAPVADGQGPATSAVPVPALTAPPARRGRLAWTRERVVEELANWVIQDPTIDAATLTRRNQSPLVAAARRLFGRFDAALNAAHLRISELYPEGPPKRGGRMPVAA